MMLPWPQRPFGETGLMVGPCAWRVTMLRPEVVPYLSAHLSLIYVAPDDDEACLAAAVPVLRQLPNVPLLLGVREPAFARQLAAVIERRMAALGRKHVEILVLWADDPADLKGGAHLQTLFDLRNRGLVGNVGLGHRDARSAEWLAVKTAVRVLVFPYSLADQAAAYRTLPAAEEHGVACIAAPSDGPSISPAPNPDAPGSTADAALRFALVQSRRILPVCDAPVPDDLTPMTDAEAAQCWDAYRATHPEPVPLPRSTPPE